MGVFSLSAAKDVERAGRKLRQAFLPRVPSSDASDASKIQRNRQPHYDVRDEASSAIKDVAGASQTKQPVDAAAESHAEIDEQPERDESIAPIQKNKHALGP